MALEPTLPSRGAVCTPQSRRAPPTAAPLIGPTTIAGRVLQLANSAIGATTCGLKAVLRQPGATLTRVAGVLACLRSVAAAPYAAARPGQEALPSAGLTAGADNDWEYAGRQIGSMIAECGRARHVIGLDVRDTEAHCLGQVAFNQATGEGFQPGVFREMAREEPDVGSETARYLSLVERGMHRAVTLPTANTAAVNVHDAAQLAMHLPPVRRRVAEDAAGIIGRCNLRERVDNNGVGEPGVFIRADLQAVLRDEACSSGMLHPPLRVDLRRANAAQFYQSGRVKNLQTFVQGQHRIHAGDGSEAADAAFEEAVVDDIQARVGV
ncbi:hypothetical protein [Stenotrophomonas sp. CFBP8980]|uniref:hypothetical protein n=1 Tax=Stenotrophomonas sp. CFBP8980 TaxID=3096523 RepID=UPI002A6AE9C7|nr:hypothetical protein [Stenotrophomonas sp. CFBP8980]MDY1033453.1 hypothetical protein [Stenotrophomonas sp. CFBP8980]